MYNSNQIGFLGKTYHKHPETGETIVVDHDDLLRNTFKSPFRNSIRDNTNYYFKNAKELESYFDPN